MISSWKILCPVILAIDSHFMILLHYCLSLLIQLVFLIPDSHWDCLEMHLPPLKRIAWQEFKLIGKEFQNCCMRWVDTGDRIYCLLLLCGILHGVAVTDACHIFETCKFLLCSTCFHVYAFLIVSCASCITFVADFIPENWLWQCCSSCQKKLATAVIIIIIYIYIL